MFNTRFRAIYLAVLMVICVGVFGAVSIPKTSSRSTAGQPAAVVLEPTIQQRLFSSSKPLFGFATLGLLSSAGLALLYSKSKA